MLIVASPSPPSLSQSDSQWLSPEDSTAIPVGQDQSSSSHKVIHNARERVVPLEFFFPTRGSGDAGKTSLHGAVLASGRGNAASV